MREHTRHPIRCWLAVLAALVLAGFRVSGEKGLLFQGVAHVYVGGLFGHALGAWSRFSFLVGLFLTAVEVACFFLLTR